MAFSFESTMHFDMTDPSGHIFYGNAFTLSHRAIEKFLISKDISWNSWFNNEEYIVPIVHAEAQFSKPLTAGTTYTTTVEVEKKGDSSITFLCNFSIKNTPAIQIRSVHVFVDKQSNAKINIPAKINEVL